MTAHVGPLRTDVAVERAGAVLGARAQFDVPLGPLTTYRVGGRSAIAIAVREPADVALIGRALAASGLPVLIVGRGSNLLVADRGFDGLAVLVGDGLDAITIDGTAVVAEGGVFLPVLARRTVAAGLTGLEWAVGVPGSVGGGVRMNAGGHGSDIATSLRGALVADLRAGELSERPADRLGLRFRGSNLTDYELVWSASFALARGNREESETDLSEIVRWRREHQPGGQNAGSVFVNPIPGQLSAAEVIDGLGLRGLRVGSAEVSLKHANFIQADEGGSADDVKALIELVRTRVRDERGIALRSEIRLVGFENATTG